MWGSGYPEDRSLRRFAMPAKRIALMLADDDWWEEPVRLYESGLSMAQVGKEVGLSAVAVGKY